MKKVLIVLMSVSFLFLMRSQVTYAQDVNGVKPIEDQITIDKNAKPQNVGNKICPVSGEKVGQQGMAPVTYEYEGKIYNFCCPGCLEEFKKDPQKYIKKVEEELQTEAQKEDSSTDMKGMDMGKGMHEAQGH